MLNITIQAWVLPIALTQVPHVTFLKNIRYLSSPMTTSLQMLFVYCIKLRDYTGMSQL